MSSTTGKMYEYFRVGKDLWDLRLSYYPDIIFWVAPNLDLHTILEMGLETAQNKWTSTSSGQPNPRPQQGRLANATGAHDQTTPQECIRETETWSFPACVCKNDHVSNRLPEWSSTLASWFSLQSLLPKQGVWCQPQTIPDWQSLVLWNSCQVKLQNRDPEGASLDTTSFCPRSLPGSARGWVATKPINFCEDTPQDPAVDWHSSAATWQDPTSYSPMPIPSTQILYSKMLKVSPSHHWAEEFLGHAGLAQKS